MKQLVATASGAGIPALCRVMKGVNMTWQKPPDVLYTNAQKAAKKAETDAFVRSRTIERTDEDVAVAVAKLRQLLDSPGCKDIAVWLTWTPREDDTIRHQVHDSYSNLEIGQPLNYEGTALVLGVGGLCKGHWSREGTVHRHTVFRLQLVSTGTSSYRSVVRNFQLLSSQLDYLMEALNMDYPAKKS